VTLPKKELGRVEATLPALRLGFETARIRLAEIYAEGSETQIAAYKIATRHSAETLGVGRVSVWSLSDDGQSLRCDLQYQDGSFAIDSSRTLSRSTCPRYFESIQSRRVVPVENARTDSRTNELLTYLSDCGIHAMLDAPIYRDGRVRGVVCHEDTRGPRVWTEKEAGFASAVADMLTILQEQAERSELRAAIDAQRQMLQQAQKMKALTKLGRIVIHDLANIMMVVSARATLLESEPNLQQASRELSDALQYGNRLLHQLREFYEYKIPESGVEVVAIIRNLEGAIRGTLGPGIHCTFMCEAEPTILAISRLEVEQLLMNLCVNAKDAIVGPGAVDIKVTSSSDRLVIVVRDTGVGMSEEQQLRLFEPYFSTKEGHSGIGLAAVFGIVSRASGLVDVKSGPGQGTTFTITFPTRPDADESAAPWDF
jgi:signal transduction histidine kinase